MSERCPTCGGAVRVVSSDDGTSYYEPLCRVDAHVDRERTLYDVARDATDAVLGAGTYDTMNESNPHPGVQAAIRRGRS